MLGMYKFYSIIFMYFSIIIFLKPKGLKRIQEFFDYPEELILGLRTMFNDRGELRAATFVSTLTLTSASTIQSNTTDFNNVNNMGLVKFMIVYFFLCISNSDF